MSALSFSPQSPPVVLVTFDGSGTDRSWRVTDDPVMGGQSKSSFAVQDGVGKFSGTCAIVPFLKAPGFCNVGTTHGLFTPAKFADASAFIQGSLYLTLKSSTPTYTGFKVDFGANNLTRPSGSLSHGGSSLKANIEIPAGLKADASGFVTIKVPFSSFSVDWSDYTGECDTKVRTPPPPGKVWAGRLPIRVHVPHSPVVLPVPRATPSARRTRAATSICAATARTPRSARRRITSPASRASWCGSSSWVTWPTAGP